MFCVMKQKRKVHQEYLKLNNENWFYPEKTNVGVKQQQNSNRIKMGMQLDEEKRYSLPSMPI